jgi:hypothetical protein
MQRGQNPSPASMGNRLHSVESSARHLRDVAHAQAGCHFDSHGQKPAQVQSKLIERSFAFANSYNAGSSSKPLALGRMIGSEKLKRNGFPQPAPQCDPLAASARSFSSVEARGKFPMSGLRVRLHRIARGGRAPWNNPDVLAFGSRRLVSHSIGECRWAPSF